MPPNDFERILLGRFQGNPRGGDAGAERHRPAPPGRPVRLRLQLRAHDDANLPSAIALPAPRRPPWPSPRSWRSPPARSSRSGSFKDAEFVAAGSRAQQSVYFQPGQPGAAPRRGGTASASFLSGQLITPQTDILLHVGPHRLAAARRAAPGHAPRQHAEDTGAAPAGRRRHHARGRPQSSTRRRSRWCSTTGWSSSARGTRRRDYELTTPLPNDGCSNAINLANMAEHRCATCTDPRDFSGSDGVDRRRGGATL